MIIRRGQWQLLGTAALLSAICPAMALAQVSSKPAQAPKEKALAAPSPGAPAVPSCDKFQEWRYGQECRRNDGKTCQVMGPRADPNELKFCK